MSAPFVQHLPDEAELLGCVNDRLELNVFQFLPPCPRVQQTLHVNLDKLELTLHLFLLHLEVFSLGRLGDSLQPSLKFRPLVLELIMHVLQTLSHLRAVVARHGIDARVVCERVDRPPGLAPDVVRLTEAALRPLRVMVAHGLHLGDLLEKLVQILVRKVVQSGVQTEAGERSFPLGEGPVDIVEVHAGASRRARSCGF